MVATGQYSKLQTLWNEIAGQHILRVKPEFAKIRNPDSGILTRFGQAIALLNGLRTDVRAVFQTEPVLAFIQSHVDTTLPVLMPFVWTSTNVSNQRTEYFYRVPQAIPSERRQLLLDIFQRTIGPSGRLREAPQDYLPHTLLASAAIPIVFDPVVLPSARRCTDGPVR